MSVDSLPIPGTTTLFQRTMSIVLRVVGDVILTPHGGFYDILNRGSIVVMGLYYLTNYNIK